MYNILIQYSYFASYNSFIWVLTSFHLSWYQWIVFQVINTVFLHDLSGEVGGATGGSHRLPLDELHRRRDLNNPPYSCMQPSPNSLHFSKQWEKRFVSIVVKPHEVKNYRNIKHRKHWKLKPRTSFLIIVAKIFRSGAHWLVSYIS